MKSSLTLLVLVLLLLNILAGCAEGPNQFAGARRETHETRAQMDGGFAAGCSNG